MKLKIGGVINNLRGKELKTPCILACKYINQRDIHIFSKSLDKKLKNLFENIKKFNYSLGFSTYLSPWNSTFFSFHNFLTFVKSLLDLGLSKLILPTQPAFEIFFLILRWVFCTSMRGTVTKLASKIDLNMFKPLNLTIKETFLFLFEKSGEKVNKICLKYLIYNFIL